MNIGLTTSFIVAGVLMISILGMNLSLSISSTKLTMEQITKQRANTISEILNKDIPNIGSDVNQHIDSPIKDAQTTKIEFQSNIDNTGSVETIVWEFTDTDVSGTSNPDDKILVRKVDGDVTEFKSGVTDFDITYLDIDRDPISTNLLSSLLGGNQSERDKIRYVEISFTVESEEQVGGAGNFEAEYTEINWRKQYTPMNLRL